MISHALSSRAVQYEVIDISAPGMEHQRDFMRKKRRKREGQRNVLPPQVFNGEEYRGDYEDFDVANEDDMLEEFLGLPRKHAKVNNKH
jgi:glutaredoxin